MENLFKDLREILWSDGPEVLSSEQALSRTIHEDICRHLQYGPQTGDGKVEVNK